MLCKVTTRVMQGDKRLDRSWNDVVAVYCSQIITSKRVFQCEHYVVHTYDLTYSIFFANFGEDIEPERSGDTTKL